MAGFPGEGEKEFHNSFEFLASLPAGYLHVFPYSVRPGTPAAVLPDQVPFAVKKQRVAVLRALSEKKREQFYRGRHNSILSVLIENRRDRLTGRLKGFSRNYIPVAVQCPDVMIGREVRVAVTGTRERLLYAAPLVEHG